MPDSAPLLSEEITTNGGGYLLPAFLVTLAWFFDSQQTFITIFTDAHPSWHCTHPNNTSCSSSPHPCHLPPGSWAYDRPKDTSIISEWGLDCSSSAAAGLPASAYFAGCLAGGLTLTALADSLLGRRTLLLLSCLTMSITGALTALSPTLTVYSALRFTTGFVRSAVGTTAMVLSTELVGNIYKQRVGVLGFVCSTLGFISLPAIAYASRKLSWRMLYLWTSIPCFCYSIVVYLFVPESPRWHLLHGGRGGEAIKFQALNMRVLFGRRWVLQRLGLVMLVGFGVGIGYYGLPLNVGNLGSDLYLSTALNALSELPSCLISFLAVERMERRSSMFMLTTVSGVCSLLCVFVVNVQWRVVVEVVAFSTAGAAFVVLWIYAAELFPTSVKSSAISLMRQAIVMGGVVAPVLVAAGMKEEFMSFGVFGLVMGGCGLFVACLPETRGRSIRDTVEEEEEDEERRKNIASVSCNP